VVVRGDTLYKIAQRYGTTSGVLASANCLANINYIYAGQQLRVPPAPVVLTPVPQQPPPNSTSFNVRIQYQRFDNGFTFWRADNGEISVYIGQANGTTVSYPSYSYGLLPDNPVNEATPYGHYRPAFGIGKVWGNFFNVRNGLGWATTPEASFVTTVTRTGSAFNFNIPDGRIVYVNPNRTWSTSGSPVPYPTAVPPTPVGPSSTTTNASYQPFDGGFVIWEGRTGNVVVFYNNGSNLNATYTVYSASQYSRLPDNPVLDPVPDGRVRPAFGIGKVWGNYYEVRSNLGWALTPEQGFIATFISHSTSTQSETCFVLPDGRAINYVRLNNGVRYWLFSTVCE
jgi:LysM repeat protein